MGSDKKLKILWHSAAPFQLSGYGVQTREWVWRLMKEGHTVACVFAGSKQFDVPKMHWSGIDILPGGGSAGGIDGVFHWAKELRPDLVITLFDVWPFPVQFAQDLKAMGIDWMPIAPIDAEPLTDRMAPILKEASFPVAMSLFGQQQMKYKGIRAEYFPHGVDTKVFKPAEVDRELYKGFDKKFIVGCVANNVEPHDRKGLVQTIEAFGKFHKKHPNSVFYFHGDPSQAGGAVDMIGLAKANGFEFHVTDWWINYAGLSNEGMAKMYNFFDVFILLSGGEGFGVPLIEAQACDTPVITTDFTAQKDLVGKGWKIPPLYKRWTLMSTYWAVADVENAVEALSEAHKQWLDGTLKDGTARKFAEKFDFDTIYETRLDPILKKILKTRRANAKANKDKAQNTHH